MAPERDQLVLGLDVVVEDEVLGDDPADDVSLDDVDDDPPSEEVLVAVSADPDEERLEPERLSVL